LARVDDEVEKSPQAASVREERRSARETDAIAAGAYTTRGEALEANG
jgi:hypothetical protein